MRVRLKLQYSRTKLKLYLGFVQPFPHEPGGREFDKSPQAIWTTPRSGVGPEPKRRTSGVGREQSLCARHGALTWR